jgi:cellulose synthase/poly-beta-1,6-N-acetylglucosamine synthase-like glycosyltransferase
MIIACSIILWLCFLLMFHSYIGYPALLKLLSGGKKQNEEVYSRTEELPKIYIVFSAYNEERVIREKMESIFASDYPADRFEVWVGSDNSIDKTNEILAEFATKYPAQMHFIPFTGRNGKSNVINKLMGMLSEQGLQPNDVLVFTDANVMFSPPALYEMAKHFKNPQIGQVAAAIINRGQKEDGISKQETFYIQNENQLKYLEGLNWGSMIGAFGACYAMRAAGWVHIPQNYLMEDFYLSMNMLKQKYKAICELQAVCYEDVSNEVEEEFKRKTRIQAGNWQNLSVYWPMLFKFNAVAFCFFSHKVLRWLGPLWLFLAYAANAYLACFSHFYLFTFVVQNLLLLTPLLDKLLKQLGVHLVILRFLSYFYTMNLALAKGFWMYQNGIKTNAWSPTKRNV